eukprot:CAMPEP_0205829052 /NCGR_PEP_ID=MMETSP0206-20130828/36892_1 /ASSEMBLY_ACC=CAM_ASM_000279 /TAXON_ID=36767 /ORGANISM="Euplotes focardii, Strain TN1" /LENGTH=224 /DNA_ID=CAMNT_0053131429 /DNA_START=322 /DNA_END=993 /DNA_ORIENTATION=-
MESCKKEPEEPSPQILDSFSSSSLTEREISLEDDKKDEGKIELYDPKTDKSKIELKKKENKKKIEEDKKKGIVYRPPSPKGDGKHLVSDFGRPMFRDTQDVDQTDSEGDSAGKSSSSSQKTEEAKAPIAPPIAPPAPTPQRSMFNPAPEAEDPLTMTGASLAARDINPIQAPYAPNEESKGVLFEERDEAPNPSKPMTPSNQNPGITGAGGFDSNFKSATNFEG